MGWKSPTANDTEPHYVLSKITALIWHARSKEPLERRRTSSNWLRSESTKGTDPQTLLSQASIRITVIIKYQDNTKFCIFIRSILYCPLRCPMLSHEPAFLPETHVQSSVECVSPVVSRVTSLSPVLAVTHLRACWAKRPTRCISLWSVKKVTCLPSCVQMTWWSPKQQSIFLCYWAYL